MMIDDDNDDDDDNANDDDDDDDDNDDNDDNANDGDDDDDDHYEWIIIPPQDMIEISIFCRNFVHLIGAVAQPAFCGCVSC